MRRTHGTGLFAQVPDAAGEVVFLLAQGTGLLPAGRWDVWGGYARPPGKLFFRFDIP